jgi:viroplasmin and RNaseH domain-containing protein
VLEVWLAEEYHGYHIVFSTREKAETWLENEIHNSCVETDELEDDSDANGRYVYCHGELVGRYEKFEVDRVE